MTRYHQFSLPCSRVVTTLEYLGSLHDVLWQSEVPQPVFPFIHGLFQETNTFSETDWESVDRRLLVSLEVFNCPLWNSLPMRDTATELISTMLDWVISGSSSQGSPPPSFQKCFHLNVNLTLCLKPDSSVSGLWHTWEFKLDWHVYIPVSLFLHQYHDKDPLHRKWKSEVIALVQHVSIFTSIFEVKAVLNWYWSLLVGGWGFSPFCGEHPAISYCLMLHLPILYSLLIERST